MNKFLLLIIISISQLFADLIHPPDGSDLSYIHVMFRWGAKIRVDSYEFELSSSEDFTSILINDTVIDTTYFVKEYIDWGKTYFWRTKAVGDIWGATNRFSIGPKISNVTVTMYDEDNYSDGYTIFGSADGNYSAIIDKNGNEIWNSSDKNIIYFNFDNNGSFFGSQYFEGRENDYPGIKFSISNNILWMEPNEEYLHHEFIQLPWGDYMGIVHESRDGPIHIDNMSMQQIYYYQNIFGKICDGTTDEWPWLGDKLVIWDNNTKEVKWSWSTFNYYNMIDYDEKKWNVTPAWGVPFGWTHVNAFYYDERDGSIYISVRNLSRITKIQIQYDDINDIITGGDIIWNMGHEYPSGDVHFGDSLGFSYQHSISLTDADNILILDNGNYSVDYYNASEKTTRALEISISESSNSYSATIVKEFPLLPAADLFGSQSGNVQQVDNGNYLITTIGDNGTSREVSPEGNIIWEAKYNSSLLWRASRIPSTLFINTQMEDVLSLNNRIIPNEYTIKKIYPNPFNPIININYEISKFSFISAKILNLKGQLIDIIDLEYKKPGNYSIKWDGSLHPSGMYLFVLDNQTSILTQKIMLVK